MQRQCGVQPGTPFDGFCIQKYLSLALLSFLHDSHRPWISCSLLSCKDLGWEIWVVVICRQSSSGVSFPAPGGHTPLLFPYPSLLAWSQHLLRLGQFFRSLCRDLCLGFEVATHGYHLMFTWCIVEDPVALVSVAGMREVELSISVPCLLFTHEFPGVKVQLK